VVSRFTEEFGDIEHKNDRGSWLGGSLALPSWSNAIPGRTNLLMSHPAVEFGDGGQKWETQQI